MKKTADFEQKWVRDPRHSFKAFLAAAELQDELKQSHFLEQEG